MVFFSSESLPPGTDPAVSAANAGFGYGTFARPRALSVRIGETEAMLIERGLQVMNVEVVGDAYAIASNYLRRTGAISETIATNDRLLEIIMELFQRGEFNKIKLANKAIAQFEAAALV
jgi:hypothetical protein